MTYLLEILWIRDFRCVSVCVCLPLRPSKRTLPSTLWSSKGVCFCQTSHVKLNRKNLSWTMAISISQVPSHKNVEFTWFHFAAFLRRLYQQAWTVNVAQECQHLGWQKRNDWLPLKQLGWGWKRVYAWIVYEDDEDDDDEDDYEYEHKLIVRTNMRINMLNLNKKLNITRPSILESIFLKNLNRSDFIQCSEQRVQNLPSCCSWCSFQNHQDLF